MYNRKRRLACRAIYDLKGNVEGKETPIADCLQNRAHDIKKLNQFRFVLNTTCWLVPLRVWWWELSGKGIELLQGPDTLTSVVEVSLSLLIGFATTSNPCRPPFATLSNPSSHNVYVGTALYVNLFGLLKRSLRCLDPDCVSKPDWGGEMA